MNQQIDLPNTDNLIPNPSISSRAILAGSAFWALLYIIFGYSTLFPNFYGGVNIPVLVLGYYISVHMVLGRQINYRNHGAWIYFLITIPISLAHMIYDNDQFLVFNIVLLFFLLFYQTLLACRLKEDRHSNFFRLFYDMLCDSFMKPFSAWNGIAHVFKYISKSKEDGSNEVAKKKSGAFNLVIGVSASLAVLLISAALLYNMDYTFSSYIDKIEINIGDLFGRVFVFGLVFFLVLSALYSFRFKRDKHKYTGKTPFMIPSAIMLWVLVPLTALYVFFSAIQISYLFNGGYNDVTLSYSANSAFALFVIAAVINYVVFATAQYITEVSGKGTKQAMMWFSVILLVCTAILLFSGLNRLVVYQNSYGYTMRRLMPFAAYIIMIAVMLVTAASLFVKKLPLFKLIWLIPLFGIMLFNVSCPNGIIAKMNIDRAHAGYELDTGYLMHELSADAMPYIMDAYQNGEFDIDRHGIIDGYFYEYKGIGKRLAIQDWQSFNISRYNALQSFELQRDNTFKQRIQNR